MAKPLEVSQEVDAKNNSTEPCQSISFGTALFFPSPLRVLKTSDVILFPSDKFGEVSEKFEGNSEKIKKKSEKVEKSLRIRPKFVRGMVLNSRRKH